jgi:hypothetical protein
MHLGKKQLHLPALLVVGEIQAGSLEIPFCFLINLQGVPADLRYLQTKNVDFPVPLGLEDIAPLLRRGILVVHTTRIAIFHVLRGRRMWGILVLLKFLKGMVLAIGICFQFDLAVVAVLFFLSMKRSCFD